MSPTAKYLWLAALSALVAFGAVYVIAGRPDNERAETPSAAPAQESAHSGINPLSTGAMTTFVFKKEPAELPEITFLDKDGKAVSLKDFRGKTILLNLWATWCGPCREEMPSLARLQKELGSDKFQVVALAVDKSGIAGAAKFFKDNKIEGLALYADPTARDGVELKVVGMPTTLLINANGREVGRLVGPATWDSADAKRLIQAQL
jgi:thiol-disulfide isomerase/thioredoxin